MEGQPTPPQGGRSPPVAPGESDEATRWASLKRFVATNRQQADQRARDAYHAERSEIVAQADAGRLSPARSARSSSRPRSAGTRPWPSTLVCGPTYDRWRTASARRSARRRWRPSSAPGLRRWPSKSSTGRTMRIAAWPGASSSAGGRPRHSEDATPGDAATRTCDAAAACPWLRAAPLGLHVPLADAGRLGAWPVSWQGAPINPGAWCRSVRAVW